MKVLWCILITLLASGQTANTDREPTVDRGGPIPDTLILTIAIAQRNAVKAELAKMQIEASFQYWRDQADESKRKAQIICLQVGKQFDDVGLKCVETRNGQP